jgi:hypothetical protein
MTCSTRWYISLQLHDAKMRHLDVTLKSDSIQRGMRRPKPLPQPSDMGTLVAAACTASAHPLRQVCARL